MCIICVRETVHLLFAEPSIYRYSSKVFALYEEGKLKGQQQHKLKGGTLQKALQGKFSARLNHFKVFQGLKVSVISLRTYVG